MNFHSATTAVSEISPVAIAVWRIAGKEARAAGRQDIEIPQLLTAIFSLGKLQPDAFQDIDRTEYEAAIAFLTSSFVSPGQVRRGLRATSTASHEAKQPDANTGEKKIRRSERVKEVFRCARDNGKRTVTVFHLLRAIVEAEPQYVDAYLAIGKEDMLSRLNSICEEREAINAAQQEDGSLALSIDARASYQLPAVGNECFTRLIYSIPEWIASNEYAGISAQLLEAFPNADSAAVVLSNEKGDLLLKSGYPTRELKFSLRVVKQVMESKYAQVWIRDDSAQSLLKSVGQTARAMYAPILCGNAGIGAVYVGTVASGREFTEQDLKQASAIGRQLGICFENQRLRRTLEQQNRVLRRLLTNFSPAVRDKLLDMAALGQLRLGGVRSEVSVLCSDIRGFTRMSRKLDAEDVVDLLNDYFSVTVECIFGFSGTVDKFVGDAILAVFGSPVPDSNHRLHAAEAALAMQHAIEELNQKRQRRGLQVCNMGIGIHCGEVLHGFIGSRERMEYTIIGDTVNVASRLCDGAAASQIVISPALHEHIWREMACEGCQIQTKHEGVIRAYHLVGKVESRFA